MADIFITGHRNPDMDSVCSAYCYANYKQITDPDAEHSYIPVRCGHMNQNTKSLFARLSITPPKLLKDVRPKVEQIVKKPETHLYRKAPVYDIIELLNRKTMSVLPVFNDDDSFFGLISVDEITRFFLRENASGRPRYHFLIDNFSRVLPGYFLQEGSERAFTTSLMTGAMPYEIGIARMESLFPEKPILVVGARKDHIEFAMQRQFPAIILTGISDKTLINFDYSEYKGTIYVSHEDTAETIRLLRLSLPVENLIRENLPRLAHDDLFDEAKKLLVNSEYRGLPVFNKDNFIGFVTRRCFIDRPRSHVIMVDHNETSQSILGIEDADIWEIIDHHRFAAERTRYPIYISSAPLGSTCTIVYQHYKRSGVALTKEIASLLLAGILADTVIMKSPTTTAVDIQCIKELAVYAGIPDPVVFGEELFSQTTVITEENPQDMIKADFKAYDEFGCRFGIGQIEVITLENVGEVKDTLRSALEAQRLSMGLDWAMLLITNVIKENSILLTTDYSEKEKYLVYKQEDKGMFLLPGILSRKKQLLPEVLRVLEENR